MGSSGWSGLQNKTLCKNKQTNKQKKATMVGRLRRGAKQMEVTLISLSNLSFLSSSARNQDNRVHEIPLPSTHKK
jgi:hypothetical protein